MSTQINISRAPIFHTLMVGSGPVAATKIVPGLTFRITIEDFELGIDSQILEVDRSLERRKGEISLRVEIAEGVDANVVLFGNDMRGEGFSVKELSIQLWPTEQPAEVAFVASTLNAALKLSRGVVIQVREIGLDLALTAFDPPLLEVGELLRERQTTYRLMVIERATGIDFGPLPSTLSGEEVGTIGFIYHAIVDRVFIEGLQSVEVTTPANEEGSKLLERLKNSPLTFPNENVGIGKELLGKHVMLGQQILTVSDPYIENLVQVQEEIARNDGHQVKIVIRSQTNRAQYSLLAAPNLPSSPWEPAIQKLIGMERQLDTALLERYNALAAGSLAGLTEEEKELVTQSSDISYPL